jgi:hypothetical protein
MKFTGVVRTDNVDLFILAQSAELLSILFPAVPVFSNNALE